jgi:hypothetical protein
MLGEEVDGRRWMYSDGKGNDRDHGVVSIVGNVFRSSTECEDFGRRAG